MFKEIIGIYRENSGKQEMTQNAKNRAELNVAARGGLIKIALGFMCFKWSQPSAR